MSDNAKPFGAVGSPVVHRVVGSLAARKVARDMAVVAVRKIERDMAVVVARKAAMDIGAETAHIETDIEADCRIVLDIADRAMTVVDIVVED
jgi:hypothetical protein